MLKLEHIYEAGTKPVSVELLLGGNGLAYLRDALNHFNSKSRMADTALEVISRWRATSTSSSDIGFSSGCSMASRVIKAEDRPIVRILWVIAHQ